MVFEGWKGCVFRMGACGRVRRAEVSFSKVGLSWFGFMVMAGVREAVAYRR